MRSLCFLLRKSVKNSVCDIFRHPAKLVTYLILAAFLIFALAVGTTAPSGDSASRVPADREFLQAFYFLLLTSLGVFGVINGMSRGGSFFKMADISLVFTAPVSPRKVLVYGLLRSLGTVFMVSFFLLFYAPLLRQSFGLRPAEVAFLILGYLLMLFIVQLITVLVYSFTAGKENRKRSVKIILFVLLLFFAAYIYTQAGKMEGGLSFRNAAGALCLPSAGWFPLSGWISRGVFALLDGQWITAACSGGMTVLAALVFIAAFLVGNADYYEDVLQGTQTAYTKQQAAKEGRMEEQTRKVSEREREGGISRGWGASVFFFKQIKEMRRRNRLLFFDVFTILTLAICVVLPRLIQFDEGEGSSSLSLGIAVMTSIYLLFFSNATGGWVKELSKPYIYLAPCSPFRKLLWATSPSLAKAFFDGGLAIGIGGSMIQARPTLVIVFILIYFSFALVFTSTNLLGQRALGQVLNKGIIMLFYFLLLLLLLSPGIIGMIVLSLADVPAELSLLPPLVWNLVVSLGIYGICHNSLHTMESC